MGLRIVPGTANPLLAVAVARTLRTELVTCELDRFPDGELRPVVDHLRGDDVYVIQPTGPPVSDHLVELLLLLDACRQGGAGRITAVLPYFGYARQDRRSQAGEAVGARVVADALAACWWQEPPAGSGGCPCDARSPLTACPAATPRRPRSRWSPSPRC